MIKNSNKDRKNKYLGIFTIAILIALMVVIRSATQNEDIQIANKEQIVENSSVELITIDEIEIYFTTPNNPNVNLKSKLISMIKQAETSIDLAIYHLSLESVLQALMEQADNGLQVRIIFDPSSFADTYVSNNLRKQMEGAGIEFIEMYFSGIMHHKFMIVDQKIIWTGTANFTEGGLVEDNNNIIILEKSTIVSAYQNEFNRLWGDEPSTIKISEHDWIKPLFSLQENIQEEIIELLGNAESEIVFMTYSFTDDEIAMELINLSDMGVDVKGIFDFQNAQTQYSQLAPLFCNKIVVRTDGNQDLMHHKVIIIDNEIVISGSYNLSESANLHNAENVLIISNIEIAEFFHQQFDKLWYQAQIVNPNNIVCD